MRMHIAWFGLTAAVLLAGCSGDDGGTQSGDKAVCGEILEISKALVTDEGAPHFDRANTAGQRLLKLDADDQALGRAVIDLVIALGPPGDSMPLGDEFLTLLDNVQRANNECLRLGL